MAQGLPLAHPDASRVPMTEDSFSTVAFVRMTKMNAMTTIIM